MCVDRVDVTVTSKMTLTVLSSKTELGRKRYQSTSIALVFGRWIYMFQIS
jgi:hypothetical protein